MNPAHAGLDTHTMTNERLKELQAQAEAASNAAAGPAQIARNIELAREMITALEGRGDAGCDFSTVKIEVQDQTGRVFQLWQANRPFPSDPKTSLRHAVLRTLPQYLAQLEKEFADL